MELVLDFIEANIQTKFHEDWVKTVASRVNKLIVDDEGRTTDDDGHRVMTITYPELLLR